MPNRWGIPKATEEIVLNRDLNCIYCGIRFQESDSSRKTGRTWEHITNDIRLNGTDNIGLCCGSCNSSKGSKTLQEWLKTQYCTEKEITPDSVALVVKKHLEEP